MTVDDSRKPDPMAPVQLPPTPPQTGTSPKVPRSTTGLAVSERYRQQRSNTARMAVISVIAATSLLALVIYLAVEYSPMERRAPERAQRTPVANFDSEPDSSTSHPPELVENGDVKMDPKSMKNKVNSAPDEFSSARAGAIDEQERKRNRIPNSAVSKKSTTASASRSNLSIDQANRAGAATAEPRTGTRSRNVENEVDRNRANRSVSGEESDAAEPSAPDTAYQELAEALQAMRNRNYDLANQLIERVRAESNSNQYQSLEAMTDRLQSLADHAAQFWAAFEDGLQDLEGDEIHINGETIFVNSVTKTSIVLRRAGQNRRFALDQLPSPLVLAIADRWFDEDSPSTDVFKAAYLLIHDQDETAAKTLWSRASKRGVDIGDLPLVLQDIKALGIAGKHE